MAPRGLCGAIGTSGLRERETMGFRLFTGRANPALAAEVARKLHIQLGVCAVGRHPDGDVSVQILEPVRRKELFLMQPTSPPVNEYLIELVALADACRRSGAARIMAVIPYFGYGRADKRHGRREPIMARVVADFLQLVRIDYIVTVDLHAPQIEGFFHVPVDSLTAVPTLCRALHGRLPADVVIVAPDVGRVNMATRYAEHLGAPVVVLHKRRLGDETTTVTHIVGEVAGRACLIVDDVISTGTTMADSIAALIEAGARADIKVAATHGLFLRGARRKLSHPALTEIVVTDSVHVAENNWPQLRVVSIAPLIAGAMKRLTANGSLSDLY